jgi:CheY-like chemotaxis protein
MQRASAGWYRGRTLEGADTYTAHVTSALTRWTVGVAIPTSEVETVAYHAAASRGLPDIAGYEVARRVRALALSNPPKLIAVSGFGQQSDLHRSYEAGFDLHLTKPVAPRLLQDVMGAITSRKQFDEAGKPP